MPYVGIKGTFYAYKTQKCVVIGNHEYYIPILGVLILILALLERCTTNQISGLN